MTSVSLFNAVFWAIMAIAFFILYNRGIEFNKDFEKAIYVVGKEVLIHQTPHGPVVDDARITLNRFLMQLLLFLN